MKIENCLWANRFSIFCSRVSYKLNSVFIWSRSIIRKPFVLLLFMMQKFYMRFRISGVYFNWTSLKTFKTWIYIMNLIALIVFSGLMRMFFIIMLRLSQIIHRFFSNKKQFLKIWSRIWSLFPQRYFDVSIVRYRYKRFLNVILIRNWIIIELTTFYILLWKFIIW